MDIKEIKEFEEKIKKLTLIELTNKELLEELTNLLISVGDIFALLKQPHGTLTFLKNQKIRQAKLIATNKRSERKNEKEKGI